VAPVEAPAAGKADRILTSVSVLLAVMMVILDMTVVNVALPHMMGALGATPDQITWVITSYIVAEAVVIPTSGFLAARFGRKPVIIVSVIGFVVASMLCGQATTLAEMVIFRLLQGVFGASVIPLSQAVMVDTFPAADRGKAMAIWGIGILLGPIMGPTVGGYITDHLDWRWVFYINLPIGIINLLLLAAFLKQTPRSRVATDWTGALLLALGVGALQMLLDRGNTEDWLQSNFIVALAVVSLVCSVAFVVRSVRNPDAILKIDLLKDRNLATATFMIMAFGVGMLSTIALQPLFLEHMLGYPAATAGLLMAPRGIAVAVGMGLVATLVTRVEPRWLVLTGLSLAAAGSYAMTWYNLDIGVAWIIGPGIVQGLGMGMIFVPLSTLAYQTLPGSASDQAASIFNLARTIGGSIGVAIAVTVFTRTSQANWQTLGSGINPYNPALRAWLDATGAGVYDPTTMPFIGLEVMRQATLLGFIEAFGFVTLSFLLLIPLVLLLERTSGPVQFGFPGAGGEDDPAVATSGKRS
jgi:DHA2 family multidrug resistance protein